jgi:glycosyltransferase involved in cell wall biosynthesis
LQVHALLTDAYGGYGGVAVFNRDVLEALCSHPRVDRVVALPRVISHPLEPMPQNLDYRVDAAGGAPAFLRSLAGELPRLARSELIYCAHLNLAPLAWTLGRLFGIPVLGALYGIEAWSPTRRMLVDGVAGRLDRYYAISDFTRRRFMQWSGVPEGQIPLLPNAIRNETFAAQSVDLQLVKRFGLEGRRVLLTLGRLVSRERAKGFDEVIDLLPQLIRDVPDLVYVIAGEGPYRDELARKVDRLGLGSQVRFTGGVSEAEKRALYGVADVYVMPSRGEGFGFVFLEAMACGVPVVASSVDGSRDAVRDGRLGRMVHPDDRAALRQAILEALQEPRRVPDGLDYFSFENFTGRVHDLIDEMTTPLEIAA